LSYTWRTTRRSREEQKAGIDGQACEEGIEATGGLADHGRPDGAGRRECRAARLRHHDRGDDHDHGQGDHDDLWSDHHVRGHDHLGGDHHHGQGDHHHRWGHQHLRSHLNQRGDHD
jgi:hypothetical protein